MSFWDSDPFFRDPFFRDPFRSFDTIFRNPLVGPDGPLALTDRPSDQQLQSSNNNNNSQVARNDQRGGLGTFLRTPRIDITETPTNYIIKADLPGLSKQDIQLHVEDDMLTIEGERKNEREEKTDRRHVIERSFGKFSRSIRIPPNAQVENADAKMENGVLEISLGKKSAGDERKKIAVQ